MRLNKNNIFLLDGCGALLTALLPWVLLMPFEAYFGMPRNVLYVLSAIACIYAIYSFSCHVSKLQNWQLFLKIIASANLLYCVLTLGLVFYYCDNLTNLGVAYFLIESMIVAAIVYVEFGMAKGKFGQLSKI